MLPTITSDSAASVASEVNNITHVMGNERNAYSHDVHIAAHMSANLQLAIMKSIYAHDQ